MENKKQELKIEKAKQTEKVALDMEFSKKYQDLCKKALRGWSRTLYQWKISFYIGLLLSIAYLIAGILIGIGLK